MDASMAGVIFALVAGLVTLISGNRSDRVRNNELIVVAGYSIIGVGFLLYYKVETTVALFAVQALIGLGEAVYSPAFDAVYTKHLDAGKSGAQWGAWESVNYFSVAVGSLFGGVIVTFFGFQVLFVIMSVLCFGSAFYIYSLKRSVL